MISRLDRSAALALRQTNNTRQATRTAATPQTTQSKTTTPSSPFSGLLNNAMAPAKVFTAPAAATPPAMTSRPGSISTLTTGDAVIYNGARSVQLSNAKYNEQAYESYNKAVSEWQANNGRRWVSGNSFMETSEPPPLPQYLPTDFNEIYADIAANFQTGRPWVDPYASRPYYMGGGVYFNTKTS